MLAIGAVVLELLVMGVSPSAYNGVLELVIALVEQSIAPLSLWDLFGLLLAVGLDQPVGVDEEFPPLGIIKI